MRTSSFVGASAAVNLSDIPFPEPIGAVRVVRTNDKFIANPRYHEIEEADINVIMAASRNALVMVEGGAQQCSEAEIIQALRFGHEAIVPMLDAQQDLVQRAGGDGHRVADGHLPKLVAHLHQPLAFQHVIDLLGLDVVVVSLHGTEAIHDQRVGAAGAHRKAVDALRHFARLGSGQCGRYLHSTFVREARQASRH